MSIGKPLPRPLRVMLRRLGLHRAAAIRYDPWTAFVIFAAALLAAMFAMCPSAAWTLLP